jgi:hypothetical protein
VHASMLGVLLERMRRHGGLDGLADALTELREESEPLRAALRKHPDQLQWRNRPQGWIEQSLPKAQSAASRRTQDAAMLAMQAGAGAATGPTGAVATRAAQAAFPIDEVREKVNRLLRARVFIIPDLAREAARLKTWTGRSRTSGAAVSAPRRWPRSTTSSASTPTRCCRYAGSEPSPRSRRRARRASWS